MPHNQVYYTLDGQPPNGGMPPTQGWFGNVQFMPGAPWPSSLGRFVERPPAQSQALTILPARNAAPAPAPAPASTTAPPPTTTEELERAARRLEEAAQRLNAPGPTQHSRSRERDAKCTDCNCRHHRTRPAQLGYYCGSCDRQVARPSRDVYFGIPRSRSDPRPRLALEWWHCHLESDHEDGSPARRRRRRSLEEPMFRPAMVRVDSSDRFPQRGRWAF